MRQLQHTRKNIQNCVFSSYMRNFLQLSVKLLVCKYYGAFQMLRTAIRTCKDVFLFVSQTRKRSQKKKK